MVKSKVGEGEGGDQIANRTLFRARDTRRGRQTQNQWQMELRGEEPLFSKMTSALRKRGKFSWGVKQGFCLF